MSQLQNRDDAVSLVTHTASLFCTALTAAAENPLHNSCFAVSAFICFYLRWFSTEKQTADERE